MDFIINAVYDQFAIVLLLESIPGPMQGFVANIVLPLGILSNFEFRTCLAYLIIQNSQQNKLF